MSLKHIAVQNIYILVVAHHGYDPAFSNHKMTDFKNFESICFVPIKALSSFSGVKLSVDSLNL